MIDAKASIASSIRRQRSGGKRAVSAHAAPGKREHVTEHRPGAWPALLLFVSGAAALIYQALWIKQLSLVVGVEVQAVTTGVSAFFAGLALGGWLFGKLADRVARPLRLYAVLEIAVLLCAVGATFTLARSAAPFAQLQNRTGFFAWALPFMLVGLPAALMGGTLPVLMRVLAPIAAWVLARVRDERVRGPVTASVPVAGKQLASGARLALVLYAIAGGIALGYEVVWSQAIVQFISTRSFAFAIVLASYLCGLMLGSTVAARHVERMRDPWGAFAVLIASAGVVALLEIACLGGWLLQVQGTAAHAVFSVTGSMLAAMCARFALAGLCIVFVPTVLLGAAFPFVLRLRVENSSVGRDVGKVVALNTAGGIAGTLLTGFVLVPRLGLVHTLAALAVAAAVVRLLAVLRGPGIGPLARWSVFLAAGIALCATKLTPANRLATLLTATRGGDLTFYEEGTGGTVAVLEQATGDHRFRRLYIQSVSNSGDAMTSLRYMRLQALLPLIVHRGTPRS
jgi:spermidine synthase